MIGARPRIKWTVVAVAATLCALTLAGGVDMVVLDHRLEHVAVRFPGGGSGRTWLVVGSDERDRPGPRFAGHRADVLLLVHLGAPRPSIVSVPRDLLLRTAQGGVERAALTFDTSAQALVDGLCRTLGVPVTHLAILTMPGFADLVDALGGVTVRIDAPMRDPKAQLDIEQTGQVRLSGADALALVRSRRAGAASRTRHAAALFGALRSKARAERHNPIVVQRTLWAATGALTLDSGSGLSDLFDLLNSRGQVTALPAGPLPRTIAVLADARTRGALAAAGYPATCTPG